MTGLLVRSAATQWTKRSLLAVDAGVHLAAIIKILEEHIPNAVRRPDLEVDALSPAFEKQRTKSNGNGTIPPRIVSHRSNASIGAASPIAKADVEERFRLELKSGPFAGYILQSKTAGANAVQILRELIPTYLISHPHLDHVSGLAINTASFQHTASRKVIAGLPSTVEAIKEHIFNDIMWPNLSDEDGGVGLVSYQRLQEGGSVAVGFGEGIGYIEVCDGLTVKCLSISHGKCSQNHTHRGSYPSLTDHSQHYSTSRRGSRASTPPISHERNTGYHGKRGCIIDSTAFFLRDDHSGQEILIFGDVEPDSISLSPRTVHVWADAAPKIANGTLTGILIECSYDDAQPDKALFGHLNPKHLFAELQVLAEKVAAFKLAAEDPSALRKRKRQSANGLAVAEDSVPPSSSSLLRRGRSNTHTTRRRKKSSVSPASKPSEDLVSPEIRGDATIDGMSIDNHERLVPQGRRQSLVGALEGLRVIIIHIKDNFRDEPDVRQTILAQLIGYEKERGLGCRFEISRSGTSLWL